MAQCAKCKRVWHTLPGEEDDHDCPSCGPIYRELDEEACDNCPVERRRARRKKPTTE